MDLQFEPLMACAIALGAVSGFESQLGGRRLAALTHVAAAVFGYVTMTLSNAPLATSFGVGDVPMYALAGVMLVCAWSCDTDARRARDRGEPWDASNYVIAFVIGYACAMPSLALLSCAVVELFALFTLRARAGCEPIYGGALAASGGE